MKRMFIAGLMSLALAQGALGYLNQGIVYNPDFTIDDPVFVNDRGAQFLVYNLLQSPYRTYNTLNYTNYGLMEANVGFNFDTYSTLGNSNRWASSVFNDTFGTVNSGVSSNGFILYTSIYLPGLATPKTLVRATNVVNRGLLSVAPEGVLSVIGRNLDLGRGRLSVAAYEYSPYTALGYAFGQFDGYWGIGDNDFNPAQRFGSFFGSTPLHWVTNRYYTAMQGSLFASSAPYVSYISYPATSNNVINVAYIYNSDARFTISPYALGTDIVVEWSWSKTDPITGTNSTDYLYLYDLMGSYTNFTFVTNGYGPPSTSFRPTLIPTNYYYFTGGPYFFGSPMTPSGSIGGLFPNTNYTAQYTAYEIQFSPTMSLPWEYAGRSFTNMPGRIELIAQGKDSVLNLDRARIYGGNSLVVQATNHYAGAGAAKIVTPFADLNLGSTNGFLSISNLLAPVVPRLEGFIDIWSTKFTATTTQNFTNSYHVLFVNSFLQPNVPPRLQNLTLRGTNVFISDVLNVLSNLTLHAEHVTIVSNAPNVANPVGQLNLLSGEIFWPSSSPGLLTLTNFGGIQAYNLMYFTNQNRPYVAFVNHGTVNNSGSFIAADYFENTGLFYANGSVINLLSANAWLHDGQFLAPGSDITLAGGNLVISNHVLQAAGAVSLGFTGILDDSTLTNDIYLVTNKNVWTVGAGINLTARPAQGSLLGTTIVSTAPIDGEVQNTWAAADRGKSADGFVNNAALGQLILDGGLGSDFRFSGTGAGSALYVDCLVLSNDTARIDNFSGDFPALVVDPNLTIYYAQALGSNGVSVAERMNGRNGGRLQWISSYAGYFSSTNLVYPDGTTNRLNAALAASCNLDSNNNGSANCIDPAPVFVPTQYRLAAAYTNVPVPALVLTWQSIAGATNSIYATAGLAAPDWQKVAGFVSSTNGPTRYGVPVVSDRRFYRLRVDTPQP